MKVGDLVRYESSSRVISESVGVIIGESPYEHHLADAVQVLWASGELDERVPPRILEVINESR
jgi:hypothetical protein